LRLDGRLGGHLLAGHVDGIGTLQQVQGAGEERVLTFSLPEGLARFVAPRGSIAVDGISLTVVSVTAETFAVSLIRHTLQATTLSLRAVGDRVNIEVDLLARYIDRLLTARESSGGLTLERLQALGY
jgi:riboflavin synthase